MKQIVFFSCACLLHLNGWSQQQADSGFKADTIPAVIVQAFNSQVKWKEAPMAIASLSSNGLGRFAPVSLVPVFNTVTGVRMEERSPGSFRLSIRGSLLRSPFGVRNVKIYWNNLPLSDATGNTYLNLVDINQISGMELVKGPSASVYGAGTGGVLLLKSILPFDAKKQQQFSIGTTAGSFGLFQQNANWKIQQQKFSSTLQASYLRSEGFREQSAMHKTALKYEAVLQYKHHQFQLLSWYTNLAYQTPGGITLAQMQTNARLSRQATASLPSAIQQQAGIINKTAFVGLQDTWQINPIWAAKMFVSVNNTQFENPFITNYEYRNETNSGSGFQLVMHPSKSSFQWITGVEWLNSHSLIDDFGNKKGVTDTVQFKDNVFSNQWMVFTQVQTNVGARWHLNLGISINNQQYAYRRITDMNSGVVTKSTNLVPAPRFALLYDLSKEVAVYTIASYGFSPPSLAEVRPSDGNYYGDLAPEKGWNFEAGMKGFLIQNKLQFDVAYYHFQLRDAIVRRNNTLGAEYYINAGGTTQSGLETMLQYQIQPKPLQFLSEGKIWTSYSYQPYHFTNYQQGAISYAGNAVTGVPVNTWVSGIDLQIKKHWSFNSCINAVAPIPLTDANDVFADAYQLVQIKMGYQTRMQHFKLYIFGGIDNVLNQQYSLGNDINAAGKRYYNPAPERNFYIGFNIQFN